MLGHGESEKPKRHFNIPDYALALDHACHKALTFRKTRLAYVKACALYFIAHGHRPHMVSPQRPLESLHLHGMAPKTDEGTR
jgi:hypothetical protein